ncbi:hypothetical protein MMC31_007241 [Peltigera leucophlebia]|nr:hypothetical protein [Peltigera leucophlebia]
MGQTSYEITKLRVRQNYDSWKEEMSSLLILDKTWPIATGKKTQPAQPTSPVDSRSVYSGEGSATTGQVEAYNKGLEDFKTKSFTWENWAFALIRRNCAECSGPCTHIHGMSGAGNMWNNLEKQYEASDLATLDLSLQTICRDVKTDFKDLSTYGENIKCAVSKCMKTYKVIPIWMLGSLFRMGLSSDLEPYTYQLVQVTRDLAQEQTIDDMMAALVDHHKRTQLLEDTMDLAVDFRDRRSRSASGEKAKSGPLKRKNAPAATSSFTPGPSKKDRSLGPREHCGSKIHAKEKSYYLRPHVHPDGWKPIQGKMHFMKNHKGGGAKPVQAMMIAFSTCTTKNVGYLDSVAEVHINHDHSDFKTFFYEPLSPLRTADDIAFPVLGKGTVLKQVLVNGTRSEVRFHDVYLSPGIHYT